MVTVTFITILLKAMSLATKTFTGTLWNSAEQIGRRGLNVAVTLLLAHFLVPEDFGMVAVTSSFIAIANGLMESGFKQALIRMENPTQTDYNTAFFANISLGLTSYIIIFMMAPVIANYFEEARLSTLIRVAGITILINAFQLVQGANLTRAMDFRALLMASVPASIVSAVVAVFLAYLGFGVWALISHLIIYALLSMMFIWRIGSWRPTLKVSRQSFRAMFGFGSRLFVASTIDTTFINIYIFVIAKVFTTTIAGYYFFADKIKDLIINLIVSSIRNVTFPALSTLQNDNVKLKDAYRKILQVTTFTVFPATVFLSALAEPIFYVFLPAYWEPAVPYLQLLCLAGVLLPVHSLNLNILQVKGRSDLFLRLEIIKKFMLVIILIISINYGITGVLIGRIIASVLGYIPNSYYSNRLINYPLKEQLIDFMPALVLSGIVGGLMFLLTNILDLTALTELLIFAIFGVTLYLTVAYTLNMEAMKHTMRAVGFQR